MYLRRLASLICLAWLAGSCSSEDPAAPADDTLDLTSKDGLVQGLQSVYDEASPTSLSSLLADSYTFCWGATVAEMQCYNRDEVVFITGRFFQSGWYSVNNIGVDHVIVQLIAEGGESGWILSTYDRDPAVRTYEKVVDYQLFARQGEGNVSLGSGRTTMVLVQVGGAFKIRNIYDHTGLWGDLHQAYESAQ